MKIALVVPGRFHAFDLACALLARGHAVTVFTNYPAWAAARFGVPARCVRSCWPHGIAARVAGWGHDTFGSPVSEAALHRWFGRWAAARVSRERWDVILCWSGVGEETFRRVPRGHALRICHRSSSHIRTQARLLKEESQRVGCPIDHPSPWIIAREEREYTLADVIYVPSTFTHDSFIEEGVPPDRLAMIPLGVNIGAFRPPPAVINTRCRRLLAGHPLQVLTVGTVSFRKGLWDARDIVMALDPTHVRFRFVGPVLPEAARVVAALRARADFLPAQPQHTLVGQYAEGDLFLLPTIEDGFPLVLAQAAAGGLPILTTPNGAGTDLVQEGSTGWVLPIRTPHAFIERLQWCHRHRPELAAMAQAIPETYRPRDWANVAADLERLCQGSWPMPRSGARP